LTSQPSRRHRQGSRPRQLHGREYQYPALRLAELFITRTALKKRIALKLLVDKCGKLYIGKLQEFDRLLQLRRHHKRLRLFLL
jgi:hypothetical protein